VQNDFKTCEHVEKHLWSKKKKALDLDPMLFVRGFLLKKIPQCFYVFYKQNILPRNCTHRLSFKIMSFTYMIIIS